ncbi:unnamed protein product [Moneuplotes crassus]|uniref:Glycogen debranching enzyme n=3 Tax=Euplotes crassus TaxID=5936 RepID=A0AAD1U3J7_EUPCR|nr:unnamed protein product [Moneuplotes crassus]
MERRKDSQILYVFCDEFGKIINRDPEKVYYIPTASELKIILPGGALECEAAELIINLPHLTREGEIIYTLREPFITGNDEDAHSSILSEEDPEFEVLNSYTEVSPDTNRIGAQHFNVSLLYPGVYFFQFKYSGNCYTEPQWIQLDPDLDKGDTHTNVSSLRIQTVLSRSLGVLDRWEEFIYTQRDLGYNAIHLTPIQHYGESMSHYSIADQLSIDDWYFEDSSSLTTEEKFEKLKYHINKMQIESGMLFFIDIVLNHTAGNSSWVKEHPEATYNTDNCPHLTSAYVLDKAIEDFDIKFNKKELPEFPYAPHIKTKEQLEEVMAYIKTNIIEKLKIEEFFLIDPDKFPQEQDLAELRLKKSSEVTITREKDFSGFIWHIVINQGASRLGVSVDYSHLLKAVEKVIPGKDDEFYYDKIHHILKQYNMDAQNMIHGFMGEAYDALRGEIEYHKMVLNDPKLRAPDQRMTTSYFRELDNPQKTKCVHNGWSMGGDASKQDFCDNKCWFYLRRYIIAWGDCIKLRYGKKPADSPYLWKRMTEYLTGLGKIFDGVRIDNAHSTPKHIAKYLLQKLRSTNQNSFVLAEFFTNNRQSEAEATRELGINGLIREMQNFGNCQELSAQYHGYGGCREYIIGKLDDHYLDHSTGEIYRKIKQRYPLPVFYDMTHDNSSTIEKFPPGTISLPHLALGSVLCCSIASTYGFDILLPKNLHIVKEMRLYQVEDSENSGPSEYNPNTKTIEFYAFDAEYVDIAGTFNNWQPERMQQDEGRWTFDISEPGIHQFKFIKDNEWTSSNIYPIAGPDGNNFIEVYGEGHKIITDFRPIRKIMSEIHDECNNDHSPIFLHHVKEWDIIQIVRRLNDNINTDYDSYTVIARSNFQHLESDKLDTTIELPGKVTKVVLCAYAIIDFNKINHYFDKVDNPERIVPFEGEVHMAPGLQGFGEIIEGNSFDYIKFTRMPAGFVVVIRASSGNEDIKRHEFIDEKSLELLEMKEFKDIDLPTLNYALYKCDEEEKDYTLGKRGAYTIPHAPMVYAGIASVTHILRSLKETQDLGHPLFNNLREGNWIMDYIIGRFSDNEHTNFLVPILDALFSNVKELPNRSKPHYFSKIICYLWDAFILGQLSQLDHETARWISEDPFTINLYESVSQFYGKVNSAKFGELENSMSAGLPHFSTQYMRCWGRDTFIAFNGLLLVPKYYKDARETILYYAKVSRHGLIPNLHDRGHNTRFNARDATWLFLQSIKDYVQNSTEGVAFLSQKFTRTFHSDIQSEHNEASDDDKPEKECTIAELIQEILQKHAQGINFREWNAGSAIDEHMKYEGFNIHIELDLTTGLITGGNPHNCGTWMDKMGSAPENKGIPGSPRDGAPIEITGLCYSVISWLHKLYQQKQFKYQGVKIRGNMYSYERWSETLQMSFERLYWIPSDPDLDFAYGCNSSLVNERGIYKDVARAKDEWRNYQCRPNQVLAMAVAPELFTKEFAQEALENLGEKLIIKNKSLGMKTLSPSDMAYKPNYDNSDETHGWNYHNGPEWVWPLGYYLIARIIFFEKKDQQIMKYLIPHQHHLYSSPWMSLPELTNEAGGYCEDSCHAQAWSIGTIFEAIHKANE